MNVTMKKPFYKRWQVWLMAVVICIGIVAPTKELDVIADENNQAEGEEADRNANNSNVEVGVNEMEIEVDAGNTYKKNGREGN